MAIIGFLEAVDTSQIRGWVFDDERPEYRLEVYLIVEKRTVSSSSAYMKRDDIRDLYGTDGQHGFELPVPATVSDFVENGDFIVITEFSAAPIPMQIAFPLEENKSKTDIPHQSISLKQHLSTIIKDSLSEDYNSYSPGDRILTGNAYQTVQFGETTLHGFRKDARNFSYAGYDCRGKICSDLGSNLGELGRNLVREGAFLVHAVEYDEFFISISRLIDIVSDSTRIVYYSGDLTSDPLFSPSDLYVCLSVFRFISGRLKEIAAQTTELAIFETHVVDSLSGTLSYLKHISTAFPFCAVVGYTDWSAASTDEHKSRALIWASKKKNLLIASIYRRAIILKGHQSLSQINVRNSIVPATAGVSVRPTFQDFILTKDKAILHDLVTVGQNHLEAASMLFGSVAYWDCYMAGFAEWFSAGCGALGDNLYLRALRKVVETDKNYDPPIAALAEHELRCRILWRFNAFYNQIKDDISYPVLVFSSDTPSEGKLEIVLDDGSLLLADEIDGYHRIAAAKILGRKTIPALPIRRNWRPN